MRRASLASVEIMLAEAAEAQDDFERKLAAALK
jgi:hypothetical protein